MREFSIIISIGTVPQHQILRNKVVEFMTKAHGFNGKDSTRLKAHIEPWQ